MEIGTKPKLPASPSLSALQRAEALAVSGAVRTELPPDATVQAVRPVEPVRLDLANTAPRAALDQMLRDTIDRRLVVDPRTREVVHQTVDRESGTVIRQVPEEALLRLRAYGREMRDKVEASASRKIERFA